jgi:N-acetylneuraminic acid mutarotase
MPKPRDNMAAVTLDGKIYVIGGCDKSGSLSRVEVYDPKTDSWKECKPMPSPKSTCGAGVINNKVYVVGAPDEKTYEYDPLADVWVERAPIPIPISSQVAVAVYNGELYVCGTTGNKPWLYSYNPQMDRWTKRASLNLVRSVEGFAVLNGKLYLIGGNEPGHEPSEIWRIDVYDPSKDEWQIGGIADLPEGRTHLGPTIPVVNDKIYVIGGWNGYSAQNTVYIYDPATNSWSLGPPMPTARYELAYAVLNNKIYAIGGNYGGYGGNWLATNEELSIGKEEVEVTQVTTLDIQQAIDSGIRWLANMQDPDGGWPKGGYGASRLYNTWWSMLAFRSTQQDAKYSSLISKALDYVKNQEVDPSVIQLLILYGIPATDPKIQYGINLILKIQNSDGSWGKNDNGEMTAHVVWALSLAGYSLNSDPVKKALDYIFYKQAKDGSWILPWAGEGDPGVTGGIITKLLLSGVPVSDTRVQKAVNYIKSKQAGNGGWKAADGYFYIETTARSLCALTLSGENLNSIYIQKGLKFLLTYRNQDGSFHNYVGNPASEIYVTGDVIFSLGIIMYGPIKQAMTLIEARHQLYENYAKALDPWYWNNKGNELLAIFGEDFIKSFTTPLGILKTIAKKLALGKYSSAELMAKEVITISGTIAVWDISSVLGFTYSLVSPVSGYKGQITNPSKEMQKIFSLINEGKNEEALNRIKDQIDYLKIAKIKVDDPLVPAMFPISKERVKKLFESTISFLEGEQLSLFQDGTEITLQETEHKLYLHVYDTQGRHVGINYKSGKIETEIPNSYYIDLDNAITILLPLNVTNFNFFIDARNATRPLESYNVTLTTLKEGKAISEVRKSAEIKQGDKQEYRVIVSLEEQRINMEEVKLSFFQSNILWLSVIASGVFIMAVVLIWKYRRKVHIALTPLVRSLHYCPSCGFPVDPKDILR